ncbi:16S rRNA (uracil(1498)-N(3))-methyltransferase [Gilvimarinus sp. SDUM040013]|uniref:Ribosomal RNA small subunit methyltransferase E n=1 Tax=Gilvimarinus gilvus TaxID=3058038 RepID=A0ABU4RZ09_9GAMM|nr:16S rRNA (uracil(1498)-N(3))-methyltransferase [Gilvimarinus sp. SDUM040013]MDO3387580.1 16S rRNA (uracil(1498)-N(3))-methyltransferase [Gilvimarinus sp. SDUM040013]MDX6850155.1 16S rRNA (uracil(1498)-N(3))-methyltransferase [Gilvimarinus sp. SDUM040013]
MRIPRVFTDQPLCTGTTVELADEAAHYVNRVLRMGEGREIELFNGEGGAYLGALTKIGKKTATVAVNQFCSDDKESALGIELAIGLSRGERWDTVLQKATELGVRRIVPLTTERCEVKLKGDRLAKKWQHWRQIIISACEQCQRNRPPQLAPLTPLQDYLASATGDYKFVLHHRDSQSLPQGAQPASAALLIGPEGGLSDAEIATAQANGFSALTLGPRVLRTETAPLAAISILQYVWGDLQN